MPWGKEDRFFKLELAHRLAAMLPNARVEPIEGGRTFIAIDRPQEVSDLIAAFMSDEVPKSQPVAGRSTLDPADVT
ncbi:MAG: hypothetical protein QG596_164 [Actinomycetota bacterium]|jgi:pimeloyl-ACP methyl ester carboxylesterase|nr:hypothetical protein [Actinomycetota bacterium]